MHVGDIAQRDDRAVDLLHRKVVDPVEQHRARVERDVPVELADLGVTGRQHEILRRDRVDHVGRRHVVRLHGLLIEVDLRLENLAAVGGRHRRAGDGGKLRPNEILPEIEQLHFRQFFAGQRQLQDRHGRRVVAQHVGRGDSGGQKLEHRLRGGGDLRQRGADVHAFLKEDFDDAVAVERLRFDVLDVADLRGQRALVIVDDAAGHIVGQQAVVGPNDTDDRNVDVRKDVGRACGLRQAAENGDQK